MKVLYVEDDPHDSELTLRELNRTAPDIQMEIVPSIAQAMARLERVKANLSDGGKPDFDVVLLDLNLTDGSGLKILSHIRHHSLPLAVVVLTCSGDEESVTTVLRTGADDYHIKRDNYWAQLPATLRSALANSKGRSTRRSQVLRLLYIESNEHDVHLTRLHLNAHAPFIELVICNSAFQALERLPKSGPVADVDVILMDYHLPGMSGLEALKEIRHVRGLDLPVILITGHGTEEIALQSLKLGAIDYIIKSQGYLHHLPYSVENAFFRLNAQRERNALVQNSVFIQSVLNSLTEHVCVLDKDGNIVEVNAAWRKFAEENGGEKKAYLGKNYLKICTESARLGGEKEAALVVRGISSVLDGSQSQFVLEYLCHFEGTKCWFLMRVTPLGGERQEVVVAHEDITERKKSELAVEQSEKRFRSLIENGSDLITVVNGKGLIQFQSPSSLRVLGFTPPELTGHRAFDFIHPEDIPRVAEAIQGALLYPTSPFTVQYRFRDCNDSWRIFESVGRNIPTESPDGFIVLNSRDITDTRKLEEQFRQAQKMEVIGQLSGGIAHDFNNILTVIQGHASLLQLEENISPSLRESADEILHASERAANLTRQLLTFSRRQAMQPRDLDLNEVVSNMTKMFQRLLGEDIQIQINYDSKSLNVHADPGMMEQILLNLAVNSRDAMPKGGRLVIETSAADFEEAAGLPSTEARSGSFVCLTVSDTGTGIPKRILSRIFEPFFTTKAVGKGTGLGLATVYGIVQQHQGWLTVYSEENLGTTFRVYLPRVVKGEGRKAPSVLDSVRGGDETILVVEDEPSLRILVRNVLSKLGYRILEAPTAISALAVWKQNRDEIKLVITDLVMPDGMTGIDLGRHLAQEDPNLKIIYTSGYSAEIAGTDFPLLEGINFIAKPFAPRKLAQTVRARLDG